MVTHLLSATPHPQDLCCQPQPTAGGPDGCWPMWEPSPCVPWPSQNDHIRDETIKKTMETSQGEKKPKQLCRKSQHVCVCMIRYVCVVCVCVCGVACGLCVHAHVQARFSQTFSFQVPPSCLENLYKNLLPAWFSSEHLSQRSPPGPRGKQRHDVLPDSARGASLAKDGPGGPTHHSTGVG